MALRMHVSHKTWLSIRLFLSLNAVLKHKACGDVGVWGDNIKHSDLVSLMPPFVTRHLLQPSSSNKEVNPLLKMEFAMQTKENGMSL